MNQRHRYICNCNHVSKTSVLSTDGEPNSHNNSIGFQKRFDCIYRFMMHRIGVVKFTWLWIMDRIYYIFNCEILIIINKIDIFKLCHFHSENNKTDCDIMFLIMTLCCALL
jgi:hypothetical protein